LVAHNAKCGERTVKLCEDVSHAVQALVTNVAIGQKNARGGMGTAKLLRAQAQKKTSIKKEPHHEKQNANRKNIEPNGSGQGTGKTND
jgi:hypothetical protein